MEQARIGRIFLVDGQVYERQPDGSLVPVADSTDDSRLDAMTARDAEANAAADADADGLPMSDAEWTRGRTGKPVKISL